MNPMRVNVFDTDVEDVKEIEIGEYYPYDYDTETTKRPQKIGDLVILRVYPHFKNVMDAFKYEQEDKYPPDYWALAKVTRFTDEGGFYCNVIQECDSSTSSTKEEERQ